MQQHPLHQQHRSIIALSLIVLMALAWTPVPASAAPVAASLSDTTPEAVVTADLLNVRSGPGTAYPVINRVKLNTRLTLTGRDAKATWLQISLNGEAGWVAGQYVKVTGDVTALPVVEVAPPPKAAASVAAAAPRSSAPGFFAYGIQAHMVHNDEAPRVMQAVRDLGFTWVKQQVEWKVFEPNQGSIDFGALDNIVNQANAAGVNVLFSVVNSPAWAREPGFDPTSGGPPANPQTYANFVAQLASRYCGTSLKAIEVWNEQNMDYEWGRRRLDPKEYMNLLRPAYNAIKQACRPMYVISGALTPTGVNDYVQAVDDFEYLEKMYQAGLRSYSDGIGAHPSGFNVPPNVRHENACATIQRTGNSFNGPCDVVHHSWSFRSTMEGYRAIMVKYGDSGKRIWPTEFGWAAGGAFDARYAYANDNDLQEQAAWTVEAYQMMRKWGFVGPAFLWNLNFRVVANGTEKAQWGIVDPGWNPLPVYNALREMSK